MQKNNSKKMNGGRESPSSQKKYNKSSRKSKSKKDN